MRRFATLAIALFSLCGVLPVVLACAALSQHEECCPPGQPCESERAPEVVSSGAVRCCDILPATRAAVRAVDTRGEREHTDSVPPDSPAVCLNSLANVHSLAAASTLEAESRHARVPGRQTYLVTGRLRL